MNSRISLDQPPPSGSRGGFCLGIIMMARIASSLASGGSPFSSATSSTVMPSPQMSALVSYGWPRITSGAIQ